MTSGTPPTWSAPSNKRRIILDAVTDAFRTGINYISYRETAGLDQKNRDSRYDRWGRVAFWAGLAALLGYQTGVVLILLGIGLMAYARGFFGSVQKPSSARVENFQAPPARDTSYSVDSPRQPMAGEERGWK
jgi:hypothetical protein